MRLVIDGDACPVTQEVVALAAQYGLEVILVASYDHVSQQLYPPFVQLIYVDPGSDQADFRIVRLLEKDDCVITQDYGLASLVMAKAYAIHPRGWTYRVEIMDQLLTQRYLGQRQRRAKAGYAKGPKPFTSKDRQQFRDCLERLIVEGRVADC